VGAQGQSAVASGRAFSEDAAAGIETRRTTTCKTGPENPPGRQAQVAIQAA
jgi:hypothetical protein